MVGIWKSQQRKNDYGNDDGDLVDIDEAEHGDGTDDESDELDISDAGIDISDDL